MGSEEFPSACYILFTKYNISFHSTSNGCNNISVFMNYVCIDINSGSPSPYKVYMLGLGPLALRKNLKYLHAKSHICSFYSFRVQRVVFEISAFTPDRRTWLDRRRTWLDRHWLVIHIKNIYTLSQRS